MSSTLARRLGNLLCVKSIVTLILTAVFAYLSAAGKVSGHDFLTVFSVVIAFYFGTQSERLPEAPPAASASAPPEASRDEGQSPAGP